MRYSEKTGKKSIEQVEKPRKHKSKLVRLSPGGLEQVNRHPTRHKKAEKTLCDPMDLYQAVMDNTYFGFTLINLNYEIVMTNSMVSSFFDKPASKLIGKKCFREFEKREAICPHCPGKRAMATGQPAEVEAEGVRDDGSRLSVSIQAFPTFGSDSEVTGFIEIVEDITERKQAEEALQKAENEKATILNTMSELVAYQDVEHKVVWANRAAGESVGSTAEKLRGRYCYEIWQGRNKPCVNCPVEQVWETGQLETGEVHSPDGRVWSICADPVKDKAGNVTGVVEITSDITERKRAEQAVQESGERFHAIFEQAADSIVLIDAETGTLVEFNDKAHENLGYTREELKKLKVEDFEAVESPEQVAKHIQKIVRKGSDIFETKHRTKDGQIRNIQVSTKAISIHGKNFIQGIWRDITERKRAEEALRQSEGKLNAMLQSIAHPMSMIDENLNIIWANKTAKKIFGSDIVGKKCYQVYHKRSKPCEPYPCFALKAFQDGNVHKYDTQVVDKDGNILYFHRHANVALRDEDGKATAVIEISKDFTERKKTEYALRASEEKFKGIFEHANDGIIHLDSSGTILDVNEKAAKIFGSPKKHILNKHFTNLDIFSRKDKPILMHNFEQILSGKKPFVTVPIKDKKGQELILECSASLMEIGGEITNIMVIARDITERKRAEVKLKESEVGLAQAQRLAHLGSWDWDVQKDRIKWSNEMYRIWGYEPLEFIPKYADFHNSLHPDDRDCVKNAVNDTLTKRIPYNIEYRIKTKAGQERIISAQGKAEFDKKGQPIRMFGTALDITERKRAEEALKKAEKEKEIILNTMSEITVVHQDIEHKVVWANKAAGESVGSSAEKLRGRYCYEIWEGRNKACVNCPVEKVWETGQLVTTEAHSADGKFWSIRADPVKNEAGDVIGVVEASLDITARKKAEEVLRESEERFRQFFENEPEYCYMISPEGNILDVNNAALAALGYRKEELIGKSLKTIYAPEVHPKMRQLFAKWKKTEYLRDEEMVIITKRGNKRTVILSAGSVKDRDGKALYSVSVQKDITEHKKAEEKLKRYQLMVESAHDAIFFKDLQSRYIIANNKTLEAFGLPYERVMGKNDYEIAADRKQAQKNIEDDNLVFKTGQPTEFIKKMTSADGKERQFQAIKVPQYDDEGNVVGLVGIARDITELKRTEKKLLDYQEQLKSLASQLTLAEERERARIAAELHDDTIQSVGISKMKLEEFRKSMHDEELDKELEEICVSLGRTIKDMRSLIFKVSSPILKQFGFEKAVQDWLIEQIENEHNIKTEFVDDKQDKALDKDVAALLFRNVRELLINVVKHSQASKVKVSINKAGNQIKVCVEDNGIGFDPGKAMAKAVSEGGFGLFSIRQRLEYLGGYLKVKSEPGRGCRIIMTAPLKQD